jgi:cysteine-rich repeat protein
LLSPGTRARCENWLSPDETQRYRRFIRDRDRELFLLGHALLRHSLSRYADVDPAHWRFETGEHGRPELTDPFGAATVELVGGGSGDDSFVRMIMPSGSNYDAWGAGGNSALRLMQDVTGVGDFEVEIAFMTDPLDAFDIQGAMFLEDADTFIRVDFFRSSAADTRLFFGSQDGAARQTLLNLVLDPSEGSMRFLRVEYNATTGEWRVWLSADGLTWTRKSDDPILFPLATTAMGFAAGNPAEPNQYTAEFDYFRNLAEPFDPAEDSESLLACPGCGNGAIEAGETCDDGNTVDGDGCSATCEAGCGTGGNDFSQVIFATDKSTFGWSLPVDSVFAQGDLALVGSYSVDATGSMPAATSYAITEVPGPFEGIFMLLRVDCPIATWSTGAPSECCDRDISLP